MSNCLSFIQGKLPVLNGQVYLLGSGAGQVKFGKRQYISIEALSIDLNTTNASLQIYRCQLPVERAVELAGGAFNIEHGPCDGLTRFEAGKPLIFVKYPDGATELVDGHDRLNHTVQNSKQISVIDCYILPFVKILKYKIIHLNQFNHRGKIQYRLPWGLKVLKNKMKPKCVVFRSIDQIQANNTRSWMREIDFSTGKRGPRILILTKESVELMLLLFNQLRGILNELSSFEWDDDDVQRIWADSKDFGNLTNDQRSVILKLQQCPDFQKHFANGDTTIHPFDRKSWSSDRKSVYDWLLFTNHTQATLHFRAIARSRAEGNYDRVECYEDQAGQTWALLNSLAKVRDRERVLQEGGKKVARSCSKKERIASTNTYHRWAAGLGDLNTYKLSFQELLRLTPVLHRDLSDLAVDDPRRMPALAIAAAAITSDKNEPHLTPKFTPAMASHYLDYIAIQELGERSTFWDDYAIVVDQLEKIFPRDNLIKIAADVLCNGNERRLENRRVHAERSHPWKAFGVDLFNHGKMSEIIPVIEPMAIDPNGRLYKACKKFVEDGFVLDA